MTLLAYLISLKTYLLHLADYITNTIKQSCEYSQNQLFREQIEKLREEVKKTVHVWLDLQELPIVFN